MQKTMFKTLGILTLAIVVMSMTAAASAYSSHGYNHMRGHHHNLNNFNGFPCHNCSGNTCNGNGFGNTCNGNGFGNTCNGNGFGNTGNGNCCGNTSNDNNCNGNICDGNCRGNTGSGNSGVNAGDSNNDGNTGNGTLTEGPQNNSLNPPETQGTASTVVEVTQLEQINTALQKGPVLLKVGAEWCEYCQQLKPVLNELATEYGGKATIMSVDVDQSPTLVDYFGVSSLPDSCVIVGNENGKYDYMQQNGKVTTDRSQARIIGYNDKQVYEKVLDLALQK